MAKITIQRHKSLVGFGTSHDVYIDNTKVGKLRNGKSQSFDLSPGEHTLQIKYDVSQINRSPKIKFLIKEGEEIKYSSKFTWLAMFFSIVVAIIIVAVIILGNTALFNDIPKILRPFVFMIAFISFYFLFSYFQREKFIKIEAVKE